MKEPIKYSMSTGLPRNNDEEVRKYPLESAEKELQDIIEESRQYLRKQKKDSSDSWQMPIPMLYLVKHF